MDARYEIEQMLKSAKRNLERQHSDYLMHDGCARELAGRIIESEKKVAELTQALNVLPVAAG
jgi:hypothetical protein